MKKITVAVVILGLLVGCGDAYYNKVQPVNSDGDLPLITYKVNGKPIDCFIVGNRMSCNWEKHNKLFEGGISK